jgi:hypothetical protein
MRSVAAKRKTTNPPKPKRTHAPSIVVTPAMTALLTNVTAPSVKAKNIINPDVKRSSFLRSFKRDHLANPSLIS